MQPRSDEQISKLEGFAYDTMRYGSVEAHSSMLGLQMGQLINGLNALMGPEGVIRCLEGGIRKVESIQEELQDHHDAFMMILNNMASVSALPTLVEAEIIE